MVPVPVNAPGVAAFSSQFDLLWLGLQLATGAFLLWLAFSGAGARIARRASRLTGGRFYPAYVLTAAVVLTAVTLVTLPLAWGLEIAFVGASGRDTRALAEWLSGRGVTLAMQIAAAALLLWIPLLLIRRLSRTGWAAAAAVATLAVAIVITTEQVVIQPMIADFTPAAELENDDARALILDVLDRCDVAYDRVFVGGDGGPGASTVVGIGPLARIVITPAAIAEKTPGQLTSTVAHELKHYLLHDNWLAFGVVAAIAFGGALVLHLAGGALLRRWGGRIGARALTEPAAFPLALALLFLFWIFAGLPVFNGVQRWAEWDADLFALEATHENEAQALWMARNADRGVLVDYPPLFQVFRATHPSEARRVRMANAYRPWETGEPGKYDGVCAPPP